MLKDSHFLGSLNQLQRKHSQRKIISTQIEARVSIRFMRMGRRHMPFYRIIAVDSRKKRDTRPLEFLGWYNPATKETKLNTPSLRKWLNLGAVPSDTLANLLKRAMIVRVEQ